METVSNRIGQALLENIQKSSFIGFGSLIEGKQQTNVKLQNNESESDQSDHGDDDESESPDQLENDQFVKKA